MFKKRDKRNERKALTVMGVSFSDKFLLSILFTFIFLFSISFVNSAKVDTYSNPSIYGIPETSEIDISQYINSSWSQGTINGSGTTNYVPKWTGANTLGNSRIQDSGTTYTFPSVPLDASGGPSVLTYSSSQMKYKTPDSRVWGSSLVDGSGSTYRLGIWSDSNTLTSNANLWYNGLTSIFYIGGKLGIGDISPDAYIDIYSDNPSIILDDPEASGIGALRFYHGGRTEVGYIQYNYPTDEMKILSNDKITFYTDKTNNALTLSEGGVYPLRYLYTPDNGGIYFGTGNDALIGYDGTDLVINPQVVGSGNIVASAGAFEGAHSSSDGTAGATGTIDLTTATSITVKNGLITAWS